MCIYVCRLGLIPPDVLILLSKAILGNPGICLQRMRLGYYSANIYRTKRKVLAVFSHTLQSDYVSDEFFSTSK